MKFLAINTKPVNPQGCQMKVKTCPGLLTHEKS